MGIFVIPPLIQFLFEQYGWRGGTIVLAGIYANICALGAAFRATPQEQQMREKVHGEDSNKDTLAISQQTLNKTNQNPKLAVKLGRVCNNLVHLFDISLFYTNIRFIAFCSCTLLTGFSYSPALIYIAPKAVDNGMAKRHAAFLMSIIGISSVIGRLVTGVMVGHLHLKPSLLCGIMTCLSGLCVLLYPAGNSFIYLAIISTCFGFSSGTLNCLQILVAKEFVSMNQTSGAIAWSKFTWALGVFGGIYLQGKCLQ